MKYDDYVTNIRLSNARMRSFLLARAAEDPDITDGQLDELEEEARKPGCRASQKPFYFRGRKERCK